jgi:hypothetical protein
MMPLGRTVLPQNTTGKPFRDTKPLLDMNHALPATLGA